MQKKAEKEKFIHPLDKIAIDLQNQGKAYFLDQEDSQDFWEIEYSVATKETGSQFPQVTIKGKYDYDKPDSVHKLRFNQMPDFIPDFGSLTFLRGAKPTDIVSVGVFAAQGFLISEKGKKVFEQFNLGEHKFFPVKIAKKEESYDYYWLHLCSDETDSIDYPNSIFYLQHGILGTKREIIKIESKKDLHEKKEILKINFHVEKQEYKEIGPKKIVLTRQYNKDIDIIGFVRLGIELYITNRFKKAIEESGITGIELIPSKKLFKTRG